MGETNLGESSTAIASTNILTIRKCALIGSLHRISIKHLQRYRSKAGYKFNRREDTDIFEQTVSWTAGGKALPPYRKLAEQNAFTFSVRPS